MVYGKFSFFKECNFEFLRAPFMILVGRELNVIRSEVCFNSKKIFIAAWRNHRIRINVFSLGEIIDL